MYYPSSRAPASRRHVWIDYVKQYFTDSFLIAVSAFFSLSEISLAASRKIKLKLMADEGNVNAARVLKLQETPGIFFTVVQIGLNAVAILGGIVGDAAFSGTFNNSSLNSCRPNWRNRSASSAPSCW